MKIRKSFFGLMLLTMLSSAFPSVHDLEEDALVTHPSIVISDNQTGEEKDRPAETLVLYRGKRVPAHYIGDFFKREFEWVHGVSISMLRRKPRPGGVGPYNLIEVSPWVVSLEIFNSIPLNKPFEFVYDRSTGVCYVDQLPLVKNLKHRRAGGHPSIVHAGRVAHPVGGEIWRIGPNHFRSNESSGHYGRNWTDESRFGFIEFLSLMGVSVLHEPWIIRDFSPKPLSHQDLKLYQNNFLRRFGSSILNPRAFFAVFTSLSKFDFHKAEAYRKNSYYEETTEAGDERPSFSLKKEYRNLNRLDFFFKDEDTGEIWTPDEVEEALLRHFVKKYSQRT